MGAQAVRLSNIDIDQALSNRDFEVLFQPIFDLGNGALARMETFVRWRHASLGLLPPGAFISFFESQGRMSELSRYVLDEAMENYLSWRGSYGPGFSINLALTDLSDDSISSHLSVLLRKHDFPADAVTFECPMPPVTVDSEQTLEQLGRLRASGARLAIEVRGRANEFLRTIEPFPFDEIKTGGAAILRFARTVRGPGLSAISELLDIANNANASITAVGVEDQASLSALRGLGFSAAQGNHLGKVGDLKDFRPAMVNSVRKLLDLDDLSPAALSDLFRTGRPMADMEPSIDTSGKKSATKTKKIKAKKDELTLTNKVDENSQASLATAQVSGAQVSGGQVSGGLPGTLETDDEAFEDGLGSNKEGSSAQTQAQNAEKKSVPVKNISTVERARIKANALARKKGKDVLRAEISARRAKLGLSAPKIEDIEPVSAAKGLQDRLSSEFRDNSETNSDKPEHIEESSIEGASSEIEVPPSHEDRLQESDASESKINDEATGKTVDSDELENSLLETRDDNDHRVTEDSVQTGFETESATSPIEVDKEAPVQNTPVQNTPLQNIGDNADEPALTKSTDQVNLSRLDGMPLTGRVNHDHQENDLASSEPHTTPSTEQADLQKEAIQGLELQPIGAELKAEELSLEVKPKTGLLSGDKSVSLAKGRVAAYLSAIISVPTHQLAADPEPSRAAYNYTGDAPVTPRSIQQTGQEGLQHAAALDIEDEKQRRKMEENYVLFSLDEKEERPRDRAAQIAKAEIADSHHRPRTDESLASAEQNKEDNHREDLQAGPVLEERDNGEDALLTARGMESPSGEPDDQETGSELVDVEPQDLVDEPVDLSNTRVFELEENEASMISQSALIGEGKGRARKRKNFLTRRYRLWPDHFWPRSWTRAIRRRQAQKEFVRKAKARAHQINNPDTEPRDSLF